jgi:anti-sigma regulatory factor (Ser/Thr protein kinase)
VAIALGPAPSAPLALHEVTARWLPVVAESMHGGQHTDIDRMQHQWEASLVLAVPDLSSSRRFDVLLSLREAVLNAMQHGCGGRAECVATLDVAIRPAARLLRATIEDPGAGHTFDVVAHEAAAGLQMVDSHRGLSLIHSLASSVTCERHGALLQLDFRY